MAAKPGAVMLAEPCVAVPFRLAAQLLARLALGGGRLTPEMEALVQEFGAAAATYRGEQARTGPLC